LPKFGAVILAGGLWRVDKGVSADPMDTPDRADLLSSRDQIVKIADRLRTKIVIQHAPADIAKLSLFPAPAR
jgi:hypothetical protein